MIDILLNIVFFILGLIIFVIQWVSKMLSSFVNYVVTNKNELSKWFIFTGLFAYPLFVALMYGLVNLKTQYSEESLTLYGHLLVWLIALILNIGIVGGLNARNYMLYKKRCFANLREWWYEEPYSFNRRKAMYPPIPLKLLKSVVTGICIGRIGLGPFKRYLCLDLNDKSIANHIVIIGNSAAGKSSGPILTSLIANFMDCDDTTPPPVTYLVVDPKPELCELSSTGGKWTRILNPKAERGTCSGWDLYFDLDQDSTMDEITDRINSIVEVVVQDNNADNAFFQDSARNLLSGCLIYEYVVKGNNFIKSIRNILSSDIDSYVQKVKADKKTPRKAIMLLAEFGKEDDKSNATEDIKKSLKQQTAVFTRDDTEWFLDTDINQDVCNPYFLDQNISIFLSIQRADLETYGVLFRLIISQCSDYLSRRPESDKNNPVVILVDEFTNLGGKLPRFCENLGFIRSKKVTYITIFQQYSQLQKLYGKEEARTILNMGHQLILSCEDTELGKIFSDKAGEFKDYKTSYKQHGLILKTPLEEETVTETKEKRIRVMNDLTSLNDRFEAIAFINGNKYMRFSKCRYYLEPKLKARSDECIKFHELMNQGGV